MEDSFCIIYGVNGIQRSLFVRRAGISREEPRFTNVHVGWRIDLTVDCARIKNLIAISLIFKSIQFVVQCDCSCQRLY